MRVFLILSFISFAFTFTSFTLQAVEKDARTIHVVVALCDNQHQNIVPVPKLLGNGKDARNNLYWGAMYGVKSYFKRSKQWKLIKKYPLKKKTLILERLLFKHRTKNIYMLADAYDGEHIKRATEDYLYFSNAQKKFYLKHDEKTLGFGGGATLLTYIGHDGLMDFSLKPKFKKTNEVKLTITLACYSKQYFKKHMKKAGAKPILWTTHLMAPEAYVLEVALNAWIHKKSVKEAAARAYHKFQKCGMRGARALFTSGF